MRPVLVWDSRLAASARTRARDMGTRRFFSHVDPDGHGPNWHVSRTGFRLPLKWTAFKKSNQIESIIAGHATAEPAFRHWIASKKHSHHILASNPFYQNQTLVGVGYSYVPNSPYRHYWVFNSAPPEK
jgi:uncharacterized protein YkwD